MPIKYKSPGSDKILAELIQAVGETFVSVIHKLINLIWNKEEFTASNFIQNVIEYPSFTVKSIYTCY
jgi:hypothetical protein